MGNVFPSKLGILHNNGKVKAAIGLVSATILLSACAAPAPLPLGEDPLEARNREVHQFNVALDRALLKPAATTYGSIPDPVERGVTNFADNLDLPADVVNNLLQGRPHYAVQNTFRFAVNSTVGILGLFDVASLIDAPHKKTDFGETLHVWGMAEGPYVELPGFGPSTERDTLGTVVDLVANPVGALIPDLPSGVGTAATIASKLGDRNRYSATIDSVLYDSADSYAQARLLFLQNRRFELGQNAGGTGAEPDFLDPYEDPYAE